MQHHVIGFWAHVRAQLFGFSPRARCGEVVRNEAARIGGGVPICTACLSAVPRNGGMWGRIAVNEASHNTVTTEETEITK